MTTGKELEPEGIEAEIPGIYYSANNSGGSWWLTDDDWYALERAGWKVEWYENETDPWGNQYPDGRFLGALATKAIRYDVSMSDAISEWEDITGQDADEQGCSCCGGPHYFGEEW